ncbi:MAG: 50S ribosomal protein L32 [Candidatus Pacebacteria bacterium]|nr:50S ribosomal protein L32 [Candidatus Paceibacterota bacterium]
MRHTRAHTKNRRSHHKMEKPSLTKNENGVSHLRHRASAITGTYRGREVFDAKAQIAKKEDRRKKKERELGKEEKEGDK